VGLLSKEEQDRRAEGASPSWLHESISDLAFSEDETKRLSHGHSSSLFLYREEKNATLEASRTPESRASNQVSSIQD